MRGRVVEMRARNFSTWLFLAPAAAAWVACFNVPSAPAGGDLPDGGPPNQSVPDAGKTGVDAGEAGVPLPFCTSQSPTPTFCDDFDSYSSTGTPSFNKWDPASGANTGGVLALETIVTVSPPNALEAQGTVPAAGINSEEDLVKSYTQFDTKPITLSASFAFNVQDMDTTSGASVIAFELIFDQPGGFHQIVLNIISGGDGTVSARMAQNEDLTAGRRTSRIRSRTLRSRSSGTRSTSRSRSRRRRARPETRSPRPSTDRRSSMARPSPFRSSAESPAFTSASAR